MIKSWDGYTAALDIYYLYSSSNKKSQNSAPSEPATKSPGVFFEGITTIAKASLVNTSQTNLSLSDLSKDFWQQIEIMQKTTDSITYGERLRQAEEIILELEKNPEPELQQELVKMRSCFHTAFQNTPVGLGVLTQQDVNHIQRIVSISPEGVCENQDGTKFKRPELNILALTNHFNTLGFTKVMHARSVELKDFNGTEYGLEMGDTFMLGKKWETGRFPWSDDLDTLLGQAQQEVKNSLSKGEWFARLGYQGLYVKFIKDLKDRDKAQRLVDQGFQLYVTLVYPGY